MCFSAPRALMYFNVPRGYDLYQCFPWLCVSVCSGVMMCFSVPRRYDVFQCAQGLSCVLVSSRGYGVFQCAQGL